MKRFIAMGVLAIVLGIVSQQQASAWINLKAGVGANVGFQSGGNCLLWGAYRNGQPPGVDNGDVCPPFPFRPGCGSAAPAPAYAPAPAPVYAPAPAPIPAPHVAPGQTQSRQAVVPAYRTAYPQPNPYYAPYGYRR